MAHIALTTLACPEWNLDTIIRRATEFGYDGVDFRGYLDDVDITRRPEFTTEIGRTHRLFQDAGIAVPGVSSSLQICVEEKRMDNVEEARRTIAVAHGLGADFVRVFGGGQGTERPRELLLDEGRATMEAVLALSGARDLKWVVETHDHWSHAADCRQLVDAIDDPAVGLLWDMGLTTAFADEKPQDSLAALGDDVWYTHIKDYTLAVGERKLALPGQGGMPLAEAVRLLRDSGYDGWYVFEHEKRWHPEIEDPEEALPAYAEWIRGVLAS